MSGPAMMKCKPKGRKGVEFHWDSNMFGELQSEY